MFNLRADTRHTMGDNGGAWKVGAEFNRVTGDERNSAQRVWGGRTEAQRCGLVATRPENLNAIRPQQPLGRSGKGTSAGKGNVRNNAVAAARRCHCIELN